jgi:hypothetical protein
MKDFALGVGLGALIALAAAAAWDGRMRQGEWWRTGERSAAYRMTEQQAHHALTGER